jgi:GTP diphosphokinase / guanosine-3',5'-bis(diphosphate) 3'-diphosphatase
MEKRLLKHWLEEAIKIATKAHKGQVDKAGKPYILHPLRVMLKMPSIELMIIAVLHDGIEDSTLTCEDLRQKGFPETIISAVEALTKSEDETYEDFIKRAKRNPRKTMNDLRSTRRRCSF